jgi:hypothetical protein
MRGRLLLGDYQHQEQVREEEDRGLRWRLIIDLLTWFQSTMGKSERGESGGRKRKSS